MQSRCVCIKPWVLWSHPAWSRSLVETPPGVPSSLKDAALPSSSCFQNTENSQILPDPRSNSQEVQGCSTGVHKQPWPHLCFPFHLPKAQFFSFTTLIPSKTKSLPCWCFQSRSLKKSQHPCTESPDEPGIEAIIAESETRHLNSSMDPGTAMPCLLRFLETTMLFVQQSVILL